MSARTLYSSASRYEDDPELTRHEAADYLRMGLSTLAALTAQGRIPSYKWSKRRLYRKSDLDAFKCENRA